MPAQGKVLPSEVLRTAAVAAPETWLAGDLDLALSLLEEEPVIVKPLRGHHGIGVQVILSVAQLRSLPPQRSW